MFVFFKPYNLKTEEITLKLERTEEGDPEKNWAPAYYFHICNPQGVKMGAIDLRLGYNEFLYYAGNIGYTILPEFRGHHYAGKACRLIFDLARKHGMKEIIITCNPDNIASAKTCEAVGGVLERIVELPQDNPMRIDKGETHKCIYRVKL